jgi:hypothetical protein
MKAAIMMAAALAAGPAPLPAAAQPHDDWQPLVKMCMDYAKANPPPHANGPVSQEWIASCVAGNYFPKANAVAIGVCVATALHPVVAYRAPPPNIERGIQSTVDCLESHGDEEQHGWK